MSKKDAEIIHLKCDRCEAAIDIKFGTYRRTRNDPHYCRACRGLNEHERINALSDEERSNYLDSKNKAISSGWNKQSSETKQHVSELRKESWKNEERKIKNAAMLSERWNNKTEEEKIALIEKLNKGKIEYWKNESNKVFHSNRAREKWYAQSKEEQERILKALSDGRKDFYDNLTEEQMKEILLNRSKGMKRYWESLSEEDFNKRMDVIKKGLKNNFDKLNNVPNKNESKFIDYLNKNDIKYEFIWYNKNEHPDFKSLFPSDKVNINRHISPYHAWDFMIHTLEGDILVDVDGSIHDISKTTNTVTDYNGNKFILSDYIQFKDSQRPYQTDGYDAYIVKCYDDNIIDSTNVINLKTNEIMSLKQFIAILQFMNMNDKEIKDIKSQK